MRQKSTSSVRILQSIVLALGETADIPAFLCELGVSDETLANDDARIPFATLARAWQLAADTANDEFFGVHLAEGLKVGVFDVLDYCAHSSPNLGAALEILARYQRLLHDDVRVELHGRGSETWIEHHHISVRVQRHAVEAALATWLLRARQLTAVQLVPIKVCFQHGAPNKRNTYERVFRCPIEFDSDHTALVVSAADLALPVATANSGLHAVLNRHANTILAELPATGLLPELRAVLTEAMKAGPPSLDAAAKSLGLSSRTLQRRLGEHATRFEDVLDKLRRQLSVQYLDDPRLTAQEVAFLLGYSTPSAFNRAFRRWTNLTPNAHRVARAPSH